MKSLRLIAIGIHLTPAQKTKIYWWWLQAYSTTTTKGGLRRHASPWDSGLEYKDGQFYKTPSARNQAVMLLQVHGVIIVESTNITTR
jgi:hypothetical protein